MASSPVTAEIAKEWLTYDPETGVMRWRKDRGGNGKAGNVVGTNCNGYRKFEFFGRCVSVHRLAWLICHGSWPKNDIDHINGIRSDNRIVNLRDVPRAVNRRNQIAPMVTNKLGLLGVVARNCRGKIRYRGAVSVDGRDAWTSNFATPEEAYAAFLDLRSKLDPDPCRDSRQPSDTLEREEA